MGERLARHDHRLRPRVHAPLGGACAVGRGFARTAAWALQSDRGRGHARPRRAGGAARTEAGARPRPSSVGTRCSPSFAGGGHNDALMMVLVLAALALARERAPAARGVAWACAIAVKWVPLVFLPLRALEARDGAGALSLIGVRARPSEFCVAVASWRYGTEWLGAFGPLADNLPTRPATASRTGSLSSASPRMPRPGCSQPSSQRLPLAPSRGVAGSRPARALRRLLLLATTWLVPWYAVWAVPLAAVEDDAAPAGWRSASPRICCGTQCRSSGPGAG